VTDEGMPEDTFFDLGPVHILTTSTINQLRELYPQGRFEVRRFRPNIVVETPGETGFVENAWLSHTAAIGHEVLLRVFNPCPRCVMTTLPQADLPQDHGILRTPATTTPTSASTPWSCSKASCCGAMRFEWWTS